MNIIQSSVFFVQVIHRGLRTTPEPPDGKTIVPCVQMDTCLLHCALFIYMEMKRCAPRACLLVCLVQRRQWKEEKNRPTARKFSQGRISGALFQGRRRKRGTMWKRRPVSQTKFSSRWRIHICSEEYNCSVCTRIYGQTFWINSESLGYYFVRECIVEKKIYIYFFLNKGQNRKGMWLLPNAVLLIS